MALAVFTQATFTEGSILARKEPPVPPFASSVKGGRAYQISHRERKMMQHEVVVAIPGENKIGRYERKADKLTRSKQ